MSVWWDHNQSDKPKGKTCKFCITHPELVKSGYDEPKSLKCPACRRQYMGNGIIYNKTEYKNQIEQELEEIQQEIWESIWGKKP